MIARFLPRILLLILSCSLSLLILTPAFSAETTADKPSVAEAAAPTLHPVKVQPTVVDGRIAFVTASLLEQSHYSKQPLDRAMSSKFFDRYLEGLDPQRLHFTQADVQEFERYRNILGDLTITSKGTANVRPACDMFNRFMERLQQRVEYVDELLKTEKFTFDSDDRILLSRKEQPYPKDLTEAKRLWRERLKFEYLQERLSRIDARKKAETKAAGRKPEAKAPEKNPAGKTKSEAEEIVETLAHRYQLSLRNYTDWNNEDVLQVYLDALAHVYDPHSDYMNSPHLESFAISMNLALSGIGAELTSDDGYCTIRRLLPGPAAKSKKINEKDRIVAVAQGDKSAVDVVDMNLNKVVQLIRGPKGTEVRLTILPPGAALSESTVISLIRDDIKLEDQAAKAKVIELPNGRGENVRLGVIDLPSFYATFDFGAPKKKEAANPADEAAGGKSTSADVARLLKKLKQENVQGVILDLRRNGGGSLEEAVKLTGLFIKQGPVVQVRDWQNHVEQEDDVDPAVQYDGPLIVLTSRFSASASEILAGALQDYGRALIVGDSSTHGKGTVQSVNQLRGFMGMPAAMLTNDAGALDPGALKLTIKKFYRASGSSTQNRGVIPDLILPSVVNESKDVGEAALDNAMPWDTIAGAKYDRLNLVEPYLADLRNRSQQRLATEPEYAYVREDIELFKKQQADKTISLNEAQRLKEREEIEARQKTRNQERLARKAPAEKVYELTLRQVDQPGLPPPLQKTNADLAKLTDFKVTLTNGTGATPPAVAKSAPEEDSDEEKAPDVDPPLAEAKRILLDYATLLPKQSVLTAGH